MHAGDITTAPRVLGSIATIAELQTLMRARVEQLQMSPEALDYVAGLSSGHSAKLFAPRPKKHIGGQTLPILLDALALKLVVMDDPERRAQLSQKYTPRAAALANHAGTVSFSFSRRHMKKIQTKGGKNSRKYMTKSEASLLASRAGRQSHKNLSPMRARKLAQARGRAGAAVRWGNIKAAVHDPNSNGHGPGRPPKNGGAGATNKIFGAEVTA